jgi:hypothetical protein
LLQAVADPLAIQPLADQDQTAAPRTLPSPFVQGKSPAHEVEDIAAGPLGNPENALAAKHRRGQLLEEELEPLQVNGRSLSKATEIKPSPVR